MRLEKQLRKPHRDACIEADAKAQAVEASAETEYRPRLWMHLYSGNCCQAVSHTITVLLNLDQLQQTQSQSDPL